MVSVTVLYSLLAAVLLVVQASDRDFYCMQERERPVVSTRGDPPVIGSVSVCYRYCQCCTNNNRESLKYYGEQLFDGKSQVNVVQCLSFSFDVTSPGPPLGDIDVFVLREQEIANAEVPGNVLSHFPNLRAVDLEGPPETMARYWQHCSRSNPLTLDPDTFAGLTQLQLVDLSQRCLTNLPPGLFSDPGPSLRAVLIGINGLRQLPDDLFQQNSNLQEVKLEQNQITTLDGLFADNSELLMVDAEDNKIADFPSDVFAANTKLKFLDLGDQHIKGGVNVGDDLLRGLPHLEVFDLDDSGLRSLPSHFFDSNLELREIDVEGNMMTAIPKNLYRLTHLETLDLNDNALTLDFPVFGNMPNISKLSLGGGNMTIGCIFFSDLPPRVSSDIDCVAGLPNCSGDVDLTVLQHYQEAVRASAALKTSSTKLLLLLFAITYMFIL